MIIMILVMTIIQVRQPKKMFTCQTCSKAFHSNFVLKVGHSGGAFVMLLAPLLPVVSLVAPDPWSRCTCAPTGRWRPTLRSVTSITTTTITR